MLREHSPLIFAKTSGSDRDFVESICSTPSEYGALDRTPIHIICAQNTLKMRDGTVYMLDPGEERKKLRTVVNEVPGRFCTGHRRALEDEYATCSS
jgi:hypothetical protein